MTTTLADLILDAIYEAEDEPAIAAQLSVILRDVQQKDSLAQQELRPN